MTPETRQLIAYLEKSPVFAQELNLLLEEIFDLVSKGCYGLTLETEARAKKLGTMVALVREMKLDEIQP